jgi:protein TonB
MNYAWTGDSYMQILTGGKSYEELTEPMKYFYDALYLNDPYFFTLVPLFDTESYIEYGAEFKSKLTGIFAQTVVGELTVDEFYAQYEAIKAEDAPYDQEITKANADLEAAKADFKQAKDDFEQAKDDFKQSDKAFKQAEKDFAKADKAFKQMEKDVQEQDPPYIKVEKMPTFQGGDLNVFRNWFQSQIQYPKEAMEKNISGRVIFSFVVEKDGSTSDFTVLQAPDKLLADEVERIFKTCPKWESGTQRGEKVRVKYTVPIVFAIQGNNATNEGLKVVGVKSQPKTAESEAAIAEFKKTADIVIKSENGKETYFVNGKEVKKEDVGAYEPEKVVVDGAHSDGVKTVYIKVKK